MKKWFEKNALMHAGMSGVVANVFRMLTGATDGILSGGAGWVAMFGNGWRSLSGKFYKDNLKDHHLKKPVLSFGENVQAFMIKTQVAVPATARLGSAGIIGVDGWVHDEEKLIIAGAIFSAASLFELFGNKSIKSWQASAIIVGLGAGFVGAAAAHKKSPMLFMNSLSLGYSAFMQFMGSPQKYVSMIKTERASAAQNLETPSSPSL